MPLFGAMHIGERARNFLATKATAFHHDKFDSDFYHWIHAAMKTE